jgi:catechol 2,3-dioxygenase-like lactoylglutathione lyase family enzyme
LEKSLKLLRAATLSVSSLEGALRLYGGLLRHRIVEQGVLDAGLAASWGTPAAAGAPFAVLAPESGADVFIRLIEQPPHPDFIAQRTYGWQAVELCVTDTLAADRLVAGSAFRVIGPPKELEGLPTIFPMQVEGPSGEVVYFTEIRGDLPSYDLPRASSLIDRAFIYVLACSDMAASVGWAVKHLGLSMGREITLPVTTMSAAFGLDPATNWTITTLVHERDVFLEFDQMIPAATPRPAHAGCLPPGVSLCSLILPDFSDRLERLAPWMIAPPTHPPGPVYAGRRAATLRGPDGTLFEVIEA